MGEGWSDFYGLSLLSNPADNPLTTVVSTGGYVTNNFSGVGNQNYYYGIRRFPYAVRSLTGGPNNRPYNPLTFADADPAQISFTDGAYPRSPGTFFSTSATEVHNAGEVWCTALWEVRAKFISRLGWAVGNRKVLQTVTDGMKLSPLNPNFLQERDSILAAAQASSLAPEAAVDVADVWAGFATRGMGFGAVDNGTAVVESFNLPNVVQTPTFSVSDVAGNNNGFPEPGEQIALTIPLTNNTGNTATGVTLQVVGGGTANYGDIASGTTVSRTVNYTVPANTPCGSSLTLTFNINGSLGAFSTTRTLVIGTPVISSASQNFDSVTAPAIPVGWTAILVQSGINFVTSTNNASSAPNSAFAADPTTVGGGTELTSPIIPISSSSASVSFRNRYDTEAGWDGGVLEISINGGAFQDIIPAGGSFLQNGYNGVLGAGTNNPIANRNAWNGNSGGYITSIAILPASAAGQNVQLKWRFGADDNTAGQGPNPGWYIDDISIIGSYSCGLAPTVRSRADFDGDGKTDVSVFRNGIWHLGRSTSGYTAVSWGAGTDISVGGDFDGDGKADLAVFRNGNWYALQNSNNVVFSPQWGTTGDIPVVGDYDGDGKADAAVFRSSNNTWYVLPSNGSAPIIRVLAGTPVPGDYDGDGKTDFASFNNGTWTIQRSTGGNIGYYLGNLATDRLVPADYDGDRKDDIAVFRNGVWYVLRSSDGASYCERNGERRVMFLFRAITTATANTDVAVFRNGTWYANRTRRAVCKSRPSVQPAIFRFRRVTFRNLRQTLRIE